MKQRNLFNLNLAQTAGMLSGARRVAMLLLLSLLTTATMPAKDITVSATFALVDYDLTYAGTDGATFETANPTTYTYDTETFTLNNPTKEGWAFMGWTYGDVTTPTKTVIITKGTMGAITFTAHWKKLLTNEDITIGEIADQIYTGNALTPAVTVKDGENDITNQCDITYSDNTNVGIGNVTITAKASSTDYDGETTTSFYILREMSGLFADGCSWTVYVAEEDLWASDELGLKAYAITAVDGSTATATEIPYSIPKNEAVLLYRSDKTKNTYYAYIGDEIDDKPTNLLEANAAAKTVKAGECYVLYKDAFVLTSSGTLPARRVYLPISGGASARTLSINGGETTAMEDVRWQMEEGSGDWYSVDGRKLDVKPTKKGVYIKDGRKVVMK